MDDDLKGVGEGGDRREDEKEEEKEETDKRERPRWPHRQSGLRPDMEWSLKERIRGAARLWMSALGTESPEDERSLMNSMARGLAREGLRVLKPRPRLLLTDLGGGSFFRNEPDKFEEDDTEEEEGSSRVELSDIEDYISEYWGAGQEEATDYTEGPQSSMRCQVDSTTEYQDDSCREEQAEDPGPEWRMAGYGDEDVGEEGMQDRSMEGGSSGYPRFLSPGELSAGWEGTSAGFSIPTTESYQTEGASQAEGSEQLPKAKENRQKRHISRITLASSGESRREALGYGVGWTEYADDCLSEAGLSAVQEAGKALLDRGAKFDLAITSSLAVDRQATDLLLYSVGQDSLRRWTSWELNPRHLGAEEGRSVAGTESRCGWLAPRLWHETGPPPIDPCHQEWHRQVDRGKTTGESVLHLQARTKRLWDFARRLLKQGKRSILVVCRQEVVKALLFHALGLQPWDFGQWSVSWPLLLVFESKEEDTGLAAVDFAAPDTQAEATALHRAMLERHFDDGILDKYAMAELKWRAEKGRALPTIDDIYRYKRAEADKLFEKNAEQEGNKDRVLSGLSALKQQQLQSERLYNHLEKKAD